MLTPFTADGNAVDHACLADLANWYIESGSAGLFTVAQSSEMYPGLLLDLGLTSS